MNLMEKIDIQHKARVAMPLIAFMVFYMVWFTALEQSTSDNYHIVYSSLDSLLPFCEYFVVPYLLWFLFIPLIMLYLLLTDEMEFSRTSLILMAGMLFFLILSTIYPTILYLRPTQLPNDGFFCQLVRLVYASDTPTNVAPSIHVFNTLVVVEAMHRSRGKLAQNSMVLIGTNVLAVLIILSTMFLKQHSVLDVLSACILFMGVVWCVDQFDFYKGRQPARAGSRDDMAA